MFKAFTRRSFLKALGAGVALGGLSPIRTFGQGQSLNILTWSHFVPSYDVWFDAYAQAWGQANNASVTVDHISFADLVPRANAEVAAQEGHDVFFFLAPPAAFEPEVLDLKDLVDTVEAKHGPMVPLARNSTFNPVTNKFFAFSDNFVPDPGDYLKSKWEAVGFPNGPSNWDELLQGGIAIRDRFPEVQIPVGLGFSQDIDSNMATRAMLWTHGGSIQDQNENVVLNSPEALAALEYGVRLFKEAMSPAVLSWNAASNNQALNAGQTSYILNSISAYRSAQANQLPIADDIFFVPPMTGPTGIQVASEHVMGTWVIWKFAKNPDSAKAFFASLVDNYSTTTGFATPSGTLEGQRGAVMNSQLYNFPSYPGSLADASVTDPAARAQAGAAVIPTLVEEDPFGSNPPNKLAVLKDALAWSTNVGHPGPANPAIGEIFDTFVLPDMFAKAATDQLTPAQALAEAHARCKEIFIKWRERGFVTGGEGDK